MLELTSHDESRVPSRKHHEQWSAEGFDCCVSRFPDVIWKNFMIDGTARNVASGIEIMNSSTGWVKNETEYRI